LTVDQRRDPTGPDRKWGGVPIGSRQVGNHRRSTAFVRIKFCLNVNSTATEQVVLFVLFQNPAENLKIKTITDLHEEKALRYCY
jgi:hypothetical protein